MNLILVASLFCLYLLIGSGVISIWQAYKIYVKKEYQHIKDRWANKPNNPEKVVVPITILYLVEGVSLLSAAALILKYGIVDVAKVLMLVMFAAIFAKKWVISRANRQT